MYIHRERIELLTAEGNTRLAMEEASKHVFRGVEADDGNKELQ